MKKEINFLTISQVFVHDIKLNAVIHDIGLDL